MRVYGEVDEHSGGCHDALSHFQSVDSSIDVDGIGLVYSQKSHVEQVDIAQLDSLADYR